MFAPQWNVSSLLGPPGCGLWWVWFTETRTGLLLVPQKPHGMTFIHFPKLLDVILQCPLLPHAKYWVSFCFCHVPPLQWPERVIHCDNTVTSLDFSANNPSQLAVGMLDGSIAIYSVQSQDKNTRVISSRWGLCVWTQRLLLYITYWQSSSYWCYSCCCCFSLCVWLYTVGVPTNTWVQCGSSGGLNKNWA